MCGWISVRVWRVVIIAKSGGERGPRGNRGRGRGKGRDGMGLDWDPIGLDRIRLGWIGGRDWIGLNRTE